jgi:hypothetical protein
MQDGLYKVEFQTPLGVGAGVVFLHGGKMHGGDTSMFYLGNISEQGDDLTADVEAGFHTHLPGVNSVFGPSVNRPHIHLRGKSQGGGTSATFTGHASEAPSINFKATLSKLSD